MPANDNSKTIETKAAQDRAETALRDGISQITTAAEADEAAAALTTTGLAMKEHEVAARAGRHTMAEKAHAIASTEAAASGTRKSAAVITEVATQVACGDEEEQRLLDEVVSRVTGGEECGPEEVRRGRRLLRQALIRRLRPLDAVDAIIYIQINGMPHPRVADRFMLAFTNIMNRGDGWLILLLLFALSDRGRAVRAFRGVVPSLWLATSAVEFGLKYFFRRRRPFSSLIQAIIVGKKPGSYSFPSGHSAAAFAGAALLRIYYPERARLFRGIAALTCFSRVYLGAHYPGDVLTGALSGAAFAKAFRYLLRRL